MGKPFEQELAALVGTYEWAARAPISTLREFVAASSSRPLIAVGSGGSSTSAHFTSLLHRRFAGQLAWHTTPLELIASSPDVLDAAVLLLSASGKNNDILAACEFCSEREVPIVGTLSNRRGGKLASMAAQIPAAHVYEDDLPTGRDGFLATNSLVATSILMARAYGVTPPKAPSANPADAVHALCESPVTVLVLYGGWAAPVATDLESKLNESGLANCLLADFRNFGHGRHTGLARQFDTTLVVFLETPALAELSQQTRALLPEAAVSMTLATKHDGPSGTLDLLVQAFHLVLKLGQLAQLDPGQPKVPSFGRKLHDVLIPRHLFGRAD